MLIAKFQENYEDFYLVPGLFNWINLQILNAAIYFIVLPYFNWNPCTKVHVLMEYRILKK